jgi:hypothetical protein
MSLPPSPWMRSPAANCAVEARMNQSSPTPPFRLSAPAPPMSVSSPEPAVSAFTPALPVSVTFCVSEEALT